MKLKSKLFELEVDALPGQKPGLRVKCLKPACPHKCTLTFKTPKGFSCVSEGMLVSVFSLLCGKLAGASVSRANVLIQKSLM